MKHFILIVDVIVKPEYQGKKIGSQIIEKLIENIENDMSVGNFASVQLIAEKGKEAFYIKQGFKRLPDEKSGAALQKIIYK